MKNIYVFILVHIRAAAKSLIAKPRLAICKLSQFYDIGLMKKYIYEHEDPHLKLFAAGRENNKGIPIYNTVSKERLYI
jgi:hypothetical protein